MKRIIGSFLLLSSVLLVACAHKPQPQSFTKARHTNHLFSAHLPSFSAVDVNANVDLKILVGGKYRQSVKVIGDAASVNNLLGIVKEGTLYITVKDQAKPQRRVDIVIHTPYLLKLVVGGSANATVRDLNNMSLTVVGTGSGQIDLSGEVNLQQLDLSGTSKVNIKNIRSRNLAIKVNGKNIVHIKGAAALNQLDFSGEGWLGMYWVDSPLLYVTGRGNAYAELGGRVKTLNAEIYDKAFFNAQYLRTQHSYVKTHTEARADLQVTEDQNTLAMDQSNIYYYKMPKLKADYMTGSGAVLDMDGMR
ncbi:MAG: DUF2807 domain-containing protein [Proteobacteria bacterium]|nr:DUF2807 domain-containing protein [Pseudomonadota bacterium]